MIKKYQSYLILQFARNFIFISIILFTIGFILSFLEELKFFDNYNLGIKYPIFLTLLNSPSILFELFPFVFLISVKFFYIDLLEKNEIEIFKNNGINNTNIISILSVISFLLGLFIIIFFYTFSSVLKNQYLDFKNNFSDGNEYLAVVNENGLWIKEELNNHSNIIHANRFEGNKIKDVIITQSKINHEKTNIIIAKEADITQKVWVLYDVVLQDNEAFNQKYDTMIYKSTFNGQIISKLFSNLNALNLFQLHELMENYSKIGYSTSEIKSHLNKLYSAPLFFLLMTIIGFLVMLKLNFLKTKFFTIIVGVFFSVLIYYLNYFSSLFGKNETIPIELSVWLPHLILFLICIIGLVKINEI